MSDLGYGRTIFRTESSRYILYFSLVAFRISMSSVIALTELSCFVQEDENSEKK